MKKTATILSLLFLMVHLSWGQAGKPKPITIGITEEITSVQLSEQRTINIYLPDGYSKADTTHYAVIYLLDGGMDEDFIHTVGLVQFNTFPWISRIPNAIVVGIVNTDRKRDMTYPTTIKSDKEQYPTTGGSAKFISFLEKELLPYIAARYKTTGEQVIVGQSLAGLLVTEILLKKPSLFSKYIIISPSLWWDNGSLLKQPIAISATRPTRNIGVYIGTGKEGLGLSEEPHVMEVDANLLAEKIREAKNKHLTVHHDYLPDENHATVMHQALFNAFRRLYPGVKE